VRPTRLRDGEFKWEWNLIRDGKTAGMNRRKPVVPPELGPWPDGPSDSFLAESSQDRHATYPAIGDTPTSPAAGRSASLLCAPRGIVRARPHLGTSDRKGFR
jgi:hypothetical protein